MSIKINIIANGVSQLYLAIINLVMVPTYLSWMGPESFGLIGFFTMLVGWFALMDMGLSPMFSRQVARHRGGAVSDRILLQTFQTLFWIFIAIAFIGALVIIVGANNIAHYWLHSTLLSPDEIIKCINIMALIIGVKWLAGLFRIVLSANERFVLLSVISIIASTLRSFGVLIALLAFDNSPFVFFVWQLVIGTVELLTVVVFASKLMPKDDGQPWSFAPIKSELKLSLSFALTAAIWVAITNIDKLVLSNLLSLREYSSYTVAVLAAAGIFAIVGPIGAAVQPRLARLEAEGNAVAFERLYHLTTQSVVASGVAASVVIAFFSESLIWMWTGDRVLSKNIAETLSLYSLGNGVLCIMLASYYLQYAKGKMQLHILGHIGLAIFLIPSLIFFTIKWGSVGAGAAWLCCNLMYLMFWVPRIHSNFLPGVHLKWVVFDIFPGIATACTVCLIAKYLVPYTENRAIEFIYLFLISIFVLVSAVIASKELRHLVINWHIQVRRH